MLNFGTKVTSNSDFSLSDIDKEEIVLSVRKHYITYIYNILTHVFGILLFFVLYLGTRYFDGLLVDIIEKGFVFILFLLWSSLFYFLTLQYYDVWYVARNHLMAVDQKEVFNREVSILRLDKIQDINYKKDGLLANLFDYGDITVQTAGSEQSFLIKSVGKVEDVAHELIRLRDGYQVTESKDEVI